MATGPHDETAMKATTIIAAGIETLFLTVRS